MRDKPRRAVGTIATAATVLIGSTVEPAPAGQARGSMAVTVQVVAACGGAVGAGGQATTLQGCPSGNAPLAMLTESASTPPADPSMPSTTLIEGTGEVRYVTLIY